MKAGRILLWLIGGWTVVCLLIGLGVAVFGSRVEHDFPVYDGLVTDEAAALPGESERRLAAKLEAFRQSTGRQFAVATVRSLEGDSIENYANLLFRQWGLGDFKRNDGVLLLVAPRSRKVRIEVGYGLEGELTDAISRVIIENAILPRFRAGDIPGGVERGADDVMAVLGGQIGDYRTLAEKAERRDRLETVGGFLLIGFVLAFVGGIWAFMIRSMKPSPAVFRGRRRGSSSGSSSDSWSSGSSSSSSSSSSSGGGSSGGGGASGSW